MCPIYDFKCVNCSKFAMDIQQSFDAPVPLCECGEIMVRQIGLVAFKVWNTDVMTQTGEENARMSGLHI